jgi:hypothetical protein
MLVSLEGAEMKSILLYCLFFVFNVHYAIANYVQLTALTANEFAWNENDFNETTNALNKQFDNYTLTSNSRYTLFTRDYDTEIFSTNDTTLTCEHFIDEGRYVLRDNILYQDIEITTKFPNFVISAPTETEAFTTSIEVVLTLDSPINWCTTLLNNAQFSLLLIQKQNADVIQPQDRIALKNKLNIEQITNIHDRPVKLHLPCEHLDRGGEYNIALQVELLNITSTIRQHSLTINWPSKYELHLRADGVYPHCSSEMTVGVTRPTCGNDGMILLLFNCVYN